MTISITTDAVATLGRVLDARAHAARTQVNTTSFEGAMDSLANSLDSAESIMDMGEIPVGVEPNVWRAMEVSYQRAFDTFDALDRQAWGTPEEETDTWSTFGIDEPTPSERRYSGVDFGTILQPRPPTTSGEPDVVGTGKPGSAPPTTVSPASITDAKASAIEAYRLEQTSQANGSSGISEISPLLLGGVAAGLVGLYFLVRR